MNRYRLVHVTEFHYDGPVSESYNEVRLRPRQDEMQSCLSFQIRTEPGTAVANHLDHFGNWVHHFNVLPEHRLLRVEADSVVLVHDPRGFSESSLSLRTLDKLAEEMDEHYDLLAPSKFVPHPAPVRELVETAERSSRGSVAEFVRAAAALVYTRFRYEKGATHVHSSIFDVLSTGAGVCQDFAHLLLSMVRMRGIPGRYVSGYLVPRSTAEPGASIEQVVGGQASHAWVEVFLPGAGWVGIDPTLGHSVTIQHVRVAYGRDYGDVAPVRGVYKGHAGQRLSVDVRVRPALDSEGHEQLQKTSAAPVERSVNQPQQQQQQ